MFPVYLVVRKTPVELASILLLFSFVCSFSNASSFDVQPLLNVLHQLLFLHRRFFWYQFKRKILVLTQNRIIHGTFVSIIS